MDRQERIDLILDHYENPRHYGKLDPSDIRLTTGNPGCGDVVTFYLRVNGEERVSEVSFEGTGCTISQAGASMVTEMVTGMKLEEVEGLSQDAVIQIMGRDLAMTRPRCATLGLTTARLTVRHYRRKKMAQEHGIELPEPPTHEAVVLADQEAQGRFIQENRKGPR